MLRQLFNKPNFKIMEKKEIHYGIDLFTRGGQQIHSYDAYAPDWDAAQLFICGIITGLRMRVKTVYGEVYEIVDGQRQFKFTQH